MPPYSNMNKETDTNTKMHITRPPNCFMLWSCDMRKSIIKKQCRENNADISKYLGHMWMNMSSECKLQYRIKADKIKHEHKILYPNYKYIPKSKHKKIDKENKKKTLTEKTIKNIKNLNNFKNIININIKELEPEPEPDYYSEVELFYEHITSLITE